jgi:hypothetical protein
MAEFQQSARSLPQDGLVVVMRNVWAGVMTRLTGLDTLQQWLDIRADRENAAQGPAR